MAYQPKSYRKFVAGTVTAAVVASAVAPVASAAASFSDVPADHQFAEAINALASEGTFVGKDGKFDMYGELTRRQAAVVFSRLIDGEGKMEQVFSDVALTDAELTKAAYEVNAAGVMTGNNGKLDPYAKLTRQQMAKIIVEHFDLEHVEGSTVEIKDLDKAHESQREYIQILAENGITQVADGNFRPTETVKRGQFAAFVYRAQQAVAGELAITEVTALDDTNRFLSIEFNKAVSGLEASDITVQDADTLDRYGVKEVKLSSNGQTATVELFAKEDASVVLKDNQDYDVKVIVDGKVLEATFKRAAYTKSTITDVDVEERTFKVNYNGASVTVDVDEDTEFDFYDALGRETRVWFDENRDLVKYTFEEDQEVKESAIEVTKDVVTVNSNVTAGEVKLLSHDDKKYDLASDFTFYLNGNPSTLGAKGVEYDFAKVVFNESGDVQTLVAYNAKGGILVEKTDDTYIFGYDNEDLDLEDYVIVKEGKQISVSDIQKDDYVFYNDDAEENGVAIVTSKQVTGEITDVFSNSFDLDGKNFDYAGQYLTAGKDIESFDDDAAEKLQAGGKVTVYFNYKGDVVFVKGTEGVVEEQYAASYLTDVILPYFDNKGDGLLEIEVKGKDGEKLYDVKVDGLDEIVIQTTALGANSEIEIEVGEDLPSAYRSATPPANGDWEVDEFALVEQNDGVDYDGTAVASNDADNAKEYYIVAKNDNGDVLGSVVDLDAYTEKVFDLSVENGIVKGLKFYQNATQNTSGKIESDDKYVEGFQLKDDTVVFDVDALRTAYPDGDDITVTTWGELKQRNADIDQNNAFAYYDEDGIVTHLAVYGLDAADITTETALITRVDVNTDNEIVRIQALVNGELETYTADKLTSSDILNRTVNPAVSAGSVSDIQEGEVVELEVNGSEVDKIVINPGQKIAGTVEAVRVGEREVDVRLADGTLTTKELASNGEVYEATDADGDDFTVENIREISVGDKVVVGLAAPGSRFAEAIVIASDAVVTRNGLNDTTPPTSAITSAVYTAADNKLVITGTNIEKSGSVDLSKLTIASPDTDGAGAGAATGSVVLTGATVAINSATQITVTLTDAQATTVEGWTGTVANTLDAATGWFNDAAGNGAAADTGNAVTGIQD